MIAFLSSAAAALGSPSMVDFESVLRSTDCVNVLSKRTFDLRVLGHTFSITNGYDFYGFDRGYAVFSTYPESDPLANLEKYQNPSSLASAVRQWSASTASIYYAPDRSEGDVSEGAVGFKALEWHGLKVYFKSKDGGSTIKTTVYQVVLHVDGYDDELSITAGSPQLIADIIACAEELDEN